MESLSALKESINIFNWQQTCNTFLGVLPSEYCISDGSYCMFDKEFNLSTRLTFSPATENPVLGERIGGSGIFVSRDYIMRRVYHRADVAPCLRADNLFSWQHRTL